MWQCPRYMIRLFKGSSEGEPSMKGQSSYSFRYFSCGRNFISSIGFLSVTPLRSPTSFSSEDLLIQCWFEEMSLRVDRCSVCNFCASAKDDVCWICSNVALILWSLWRSNHPVRGHCCWRIHKVANSLKEMFEVTSISHRFSHSVTVISTSTCSSPFNAQKLHKV